MRYTARVEWERGASAFVDNRYSRRHRWRFDGGVEVVASSSPHVVPLPWSDAAAIDPEEAFVASLSSCHMLCFLSLAARRGWCVDAYADEAEGLLERNADGREMMSVVTLRPRVRFSGGAPDSPTYHAVHHAAHEACFIANSVRTEVRCEPTID